MRIKFKNITLFLSLSATFLLISCNYSEAPTVYNPTLVFTRAFEITVTPYVYSDITDGKKYQVSGDTTLDTLGPQPEFQWNLVPSNIVTVALFNEAVQVSANEIQNPENIIWQWHSSMPSEKVEINNSYFRKIQYEQGKTVINKKIQYDTQPLPLQSGLYYWVVWSWDNGGRWVLYSSKQFKFRVE